MSLLSVKNLKIYYPVRSGLINRTKEYVKAVDGVNLKIEKKKTYGLVGESGSGKSSLGKGILGLESVSDGEIIYEGKNLVNLSRKQRKEFHRNVQVIFQNSLASFNPRKRIRDILAEPIRNFEHLSTRDELSRIKELLDIIGLHSDVLSKFPHEFSGGQLQRIGIARAVSTRPKLIIADEPVSALDLSIQAQILNYMKDIQDEFDLSYLFISHDLGVVKQMCDELAIMYQGRFVEYGSREDIYEDPQHIYTKRLLSSIPTIDPLERDHLEKKREIIEKDFQKQQDNFSRQPGKIPDLSQIGDGIHFVAQ